MNYFDVFVIKGFTVSPEVLKEKNGGIFYPSR